MLQLAACAGAIAVLLVPGLLIESLLPRRGEWLVRLAMAIGYGLAFWPLLFLWTSAAGFRWSTASARVVLAILAIACVIVMVIRRRGAFRFRNVPFRWTLLTVALFGLVAVTRVSQIRGVVLPLWVDSVHHTMIARLLIDQGTLPSTYAPFIPGSSFYYHWGFHAVVAFVAWVTGLTAPIDVARLLLVFGQLLNALTFVSMYAAGRTLLGTRRAALLTAVLATLVSYFPAYYVSWGRYTHLTGLLLLAPIGIALWRSRRSARPVAGGRWPVATRPPHDLQLLPGTGHRPPAPRHSLANAISLAFLSAGLILIHVRIAFFAATFAAVLAIALLLARRVRALAVWAAAAVVALLLVAPWLLRLTRNENVRRIVAPAVAEQAQWETSNAVQDDLIWAPNNVPLMLTASAGLLGLTRLAPMTPAWRLAAIAWWIALALALRKRGSRRFAPRFALLAGWTALTALLVNSARFGLPPLRVVPNSAAIITLFVPLSLAAAGLLNWFLTRVSPRRASLLAAIAATVIGILGASTMWQVINPLTLLARDGDLRALAWIREHTPREATFAVGVQPWMAGSFVGIDGGYWIPVLTDRRSLLPPGLYTWVEPAEETARVNARLSAWSAASEPSPAILGMLRAAGVTDVYFGPTNRSPMRTLLVAEGAGRVTYEEDGVTIVHLMKEQ
jgi:hypothetical protein